MVPSKKAINPDSSQEPVSRLDIENVGLLPGLEDEIEPEIALSCRLDFAAGSIKFDR